MIKPWGAVCAGVALGLAGFTACSGKVSSGAEHQASPSPGEPCGTVGSTERAPDGCTTCTCDQTGRWVCAASTCTACRPGSTKQADDDCNTCHCGEDGTWSCSLVACIACRPGATKPAGDGCNGCQCTQDGTWACTTIACNPIDASPDRSTPAPDREGGLLDVVAAPDTSGCVYYSHGGGFALGYSVASAPPVPLGGPLVDGAYALTALEYYYDPDGDGGRALTQARRTETLFIKDGIFAFVGAMVELEPIKQETYSISSRNGPRLQLAGICGTTQPLGLLYTSRSEPGGQVSLQLHFLWPDGGPSSEVRTYKKL